MNVSTLQGPPPAQISWSTTKAQEREADFLSLRLLNKRMRIRVSPQPPDLSIIDGKGNHFVLSQHKGWFAAIARGASGENRIVFSTLSDLRISIQSSTAEGEQELQPKRALNYSGSPPTYLTLGANDERLMVGHADGSISMYDTSRLFVEGEDFVQPFQTLPPAPPGPIRQIVGNPGDLPDLVAVRREAESGGEGVAVEVLDVRNGQSVGGWRNGGSPETTPTSVAWSPKGKQIAIGFRNGDIVTFSPSDTNSPKQHIPKPPQVGDASVIGIIWLSNSVFYGIYTTPGDRSPEAAQKHFLTIRDAKTNAAVQMQFETPYYPTPALRPPGAFPVVLRNWDPAKFLIFISDSTSGDIGVVGSLIGKGSDDETWCNLSLEETSTPSLPLDKDDNDTFPLALELDVTTSDSNDAKPILYLYASDGTLQAWSISNNEGVPYPGLVSASALASANTNSSLPEESMVTDKPAPPSFGQSPGSSSSFGSAGFGSATPAPAFGQSATPVFGSSSFGNLTQTNNPQPDPVKSVFGQTSTPAFDAPSFGSSTAFGQASKSTPAFGQSSAFGSQTSAFGSSPTASSGFSSFASQGPPKFGSTGFGFGAASPSPAASSNNTTSAPSPPVDAASPEAEMSEADDEKANSGFGGLSLGGTSASKAQESGAVNSMFGSFAQNPSPNRTSFGSGKSPQQPSSFGAFGNVQGSSFIKPATGFGASSASFKSAETPVQNPSTTTEPKSSAAFGSKAHPAFGQPTFGQTTFGQTSFGAISKPTFGVSSTPNSSGTGGAFSAFAGNSKGFGSFAQGGSTAFGQLSQSKSNENSSDTKDVTPTEAASSSVFGANKTSAFSGLGQQGSKPSPFGTSSQSTNAFGGASFSTPSAKEASGSVFGTPSAPSLATAPTTRMKTPESSPEGSPVATERSTFDKADLLTQDSPSGEAKTTSSGVAFNQSTPPATPSPSAFKASSPATTTGAFGNLTSSPSFIRPAEGFGAFGASAKVPSTSPFANPKPITTSAFGSPVSATGSGGSGPAFASTTPVKPGTTTPTFGSPSAFGSAPAFGKTAFSTPASTTPAATPTKPAVGAFSAYSGGGGFTAYAGPTKSSFSELLKTKDESEAKEKKPASNVFANSSSITENKTSASVKSGLQAESSFVTIPKPGEIDHDNLPPTPSSHGTFDDEEDEDRNNSDDGGSFLSENFSDEVPEEGEYEDGDEDNEKDEEGEEGLSPKIPRTTGTQGFKEDTPKATPAKDSREGTYTISTTPGGPEKPLVFGKAPEPTSPSLFGSKPSVDGVASKSPSPSVFGKTFSFGQSPSPLPGKTSSSEAGPSTTPSTFAKPAVPSLTQTTTPPGSPGKEEPAAVLAPKPVSPALTSTSSLGLGRPSSRPTKSSPLAGAPVTNETEVASRAVSPKRTYSQVDNTAIKLEPVTPLIPRSTNSQLSKTPPPFGGPSSVPVKPPTLQPFSLSPASNPPPFKIPSATPVSSPAGPAAGPNAIFNMQPQTPVSGVPLPMGRPLFGSPVQGTSTSPSNVTAPNVSQQPQLEMQTKFESEMQAGCYQLCVLLQKELNDLQKASQDAAVIRARVGRSTGITHSKADFGDKTKWALGDIDAFTRLLKSVETDILAWYDFKAEIMPTMREVESNLLKAETRKEEIVRFSKAKADPEFSKMLKMRTLGPDATETQSQLRKQIRLINDRVEQLEAHLKACKKKVEEHRKGRTSMKPPSLDTINRTYRNIDLALEMQLQQISELSERVSRLDLRALDSSVSRASSLPPTSNGTNSVHFDGNGPSTNGKSGKGRFRPEVTPSVAASTAAALNAERSAMRLKLALAKVRTTPLLNTQAVDEPKRRVPTLEAERKPAFAANGLPGGPLSIALPPAPWSTPLPPGTGIGTNPSNAAQGTPSSLDLSPETSPTSQRLAYARGSRHSVHAKAPPLGKTHAKVPSEIRSFDWGPLPGAKPMTSLSADVRPEMARNAS